VQKGEPKIWGGGEMSDAVLFTHAANTEVPLIFNKIEYS